MCTGEVAPAQDGILKAVDFVPKRNDADQVAFSGRVESDDAVYYALFCGESSNLIEVVRGGQAVPDGNGTLSGSEDVSNNYAINNEGHIAFHRSDNTAGGASDNQGLFLFDGTNIVQVARKGESLSGSTLTSIFFSGLGQSGQPLNDNMQIADRATLADGREMIVA